MYFLGLHITRGAEPSLSMVLSLGLFIFLLIFYN
jgi:hypothetical protein